MGSWKANVKTRDRGLDYFVLSIFSFLGKLNTGQLALKPAVFL